MVLRMVYKSDEEELASCQADQEIRRVKDDLARFLVNKLDPMGVRDSWAKAMALVAPGEKISEDEALIRMINFVAGNLDLNIFQQYPNETFQTVCVRNHKFRVPRWQIGIAKAVIYLGEAVKAKAKVQQIEDDFNAKFPS